MSEQPKNTRFCLTTTEYDNLMQAVRYGIIIVTTVLITFLVVATAAQFLGYEPPSRGDDSTEATQETSFSIQSHYL